MQHAVLEFDAAVQSPWRPMLGSGTGRRVAGHLRPVPFPAPAPLPATGARPPAGRPAPPRRDPVRPAGRAVGPGVPAAVGRPGVPRRRGGGLRLTTRGRRVVALFLTTLVVTLGVLAGSVLASAGVGPFRLAGESSVVVEQGDTLWSIAGSVSGGDDVRAVVDRIRRLNHLVSAEVVPGQVLRLP